jgi:UDP-2-acetamido-3-amino-2,3-dideoxy-glucuronate N-acetyltransferase
MGSKMATEVAISSQDCEIRNEVTGVDSTRMSTTFIHPLADVQSDSIGEGTRVWQFVIVFAGAHIGRDCNICSHCLIESDVVIGDRVTVKSGVQLWNGLRVADDVFIGPNVSFTNDKMPRSKHKPVTFEQTVVESGASIGAGATILPSLSIGRNAMIGAGAVVTRSVPANAVVAGNPAKIIGYVDAIRSTDAADDTTAVGASHVAGVTLHRLPRIVDMRGALIVGEFARIIPFEVKRYFMVFDVPTVETRGEHAHRTCHEFLVCVRGHCTLVADDGRRRQEFLLNRPDVGLYLPPMVWRIHYRYSADAILLVFASHPYDSGDYIRDYAEFRRILVSGT